MILFRKSGPAMVFFTLSMGWGLAPQADARSARLPLVSTASQRADATTKPLPPALAAALRLYVRLEYEKALEQLARSKLAHWDTEVRVLAWLYEGIIHANLGHADRSREAFRNGLRLQPSSVLPIEVSPKIAQLFQDVRNEVQQETSASSPPASPPAEVPASAGHSEGTLLTQQSELPSVPPDHEQAESSPPSLGNDPLSPRTPPEENAVRQPTTVPWAPTSPLNPEESGSVKSHHVAFALGGILASTGIVLLTIGGFADPENKPMPILAGSLAVVGGLNIIAIGSITSTGQRGPSTVGALQRRSASFGARLSF